MGNEKIIEYFESDKSSWYYINGVGKKIWDKNKVNEFWKKIREHKIKKKDYKFVNICFPEFEFSEINFAKYSTKENENFWMKGDNREINDTLIFSNCKFQSQADFSFGFYNKDIQFINCIFEDSLFYHNSIISGNFIINSCKFYNSVNFNSSIFNKNFNIYNSSLNKESLIIDATFHNDVIIYETIFSKNTSFNKSKFKKNLEINQSNFVGKVIFFKTEIFEIEIKNTSFEDKLTLHKTLINSKGTFNNVYFSKEEITSFEYLKKLDLKVLTFEEYEALHYLFKSYDDLKILNDNFSALSGNNSKKIPSFKEHITKTISNPNLKIKFNSLNKLNEKELMTKFKLFLDGKCYLRNPNLSFHFIEFNSNFYFREINLSNTSFLKSDISEIKFRDCEFKITERLYLLDEISKKTGYKELETLYRHLKKSFERDKNWELMDKSYVSEMKMKQNYLYKQKEYFTWSMYKFYEIFASYTQDFIRPFIWYIISTLLIFPVSYYLNYLIRNNIYSFSEIKTLSWNIPHYLQLSFAASLPLINTNLAYSSWWIQTLQIIFSTILITFFIFALRRRFRF